MNPEVMAAVARVVAPGGLVAGDDGPAWTAAETPWRGPCGRAAAIVRPANVGEALAVVRLAVERGWRIVAQGANTSLCGAATPDTSGAFIVVGTDRLRQMGDVDVRGRTVVVDAGVRLSAIAEAAHARGLMLPIDVSSDPTIGGMIATNAAGTRAVRFGATGDWVAGLDVVTSTGGGSLSGNVDRPPRDSRFPALWAPFVGSNGGFGLVVRARMRLTPVDHERAVAWCPVDGIADALAIVDALRVDDRSPLTAAEFIGTEALAAVHRRQPGELTASVPGAAVLLAEVGADRPGAGVDHLTAVLASRSSAVMADPTRAWGVRHSVTEALAATGYVVGCDICVEPGRLAAAYDRAVERLAPLGGAARVCEFGHIGQGALHLNVVVDDPGLSETVREAVHSAVAEFGGTFSAEHGIGPLNSRWWTRYSEPADRAVYRAYKSALDPAGVFGHSRDG